MAQAAARAEVASGRDPTTDAVEAVRAYEAGLKTQPRHVGFHRGILIARATQAQALARDGQDPKNVVDQARTAFVRARTAQVPLSTLAPFFVDTLLSSATRLLAQGQDPGVYLGEAGRLQIHEVQGSEDPVGNGVVRLRYLALMVRTGHRPQPPGLREAGDTLIRSLVRLKPVDPGFWMALAQFKEACGDPAAAAQARARGKALNPKWRAF